MISSWLRRRPVATDKLWVLEVYVLQYLIESGLSRKLCAFRMQTHPSTGEVAGVFESIQPSDTDLGSKAPKDVKITGLWYGQLS